MAVVMRPSIGLSDVIARGDLKRTQSGAVQRPFRPSRFDFNLLAVAQAAVETRVPTALVLPVSGTYTGVLLASSILVSHFVRTSQLSAQVALVTKQLRLRSFYDTLIVGRSGRLASYFPRTVIASDGQVSRVGSRENPTTAGSGRLHFVPELGRVPAIGFHHAPGHHGLDGVVVESQASGEACLRRLLRTLGGSVPLIYLTIDPYDPSLPDFETSGAIWAWDAAALSELVTGDATEDAICAELTVLQGASRTSFVVAGPDVSTSLGDALARLWDDLSELQHHPGGPGFETIRWAWGVLGALSQLATPLELHDRFARANWGTAAISDAPAKAATFARHALNADDRDYWEVLAEDLTESIEAAVRTNPKPSGMATWVKERCERAEPGVVVVRNTASVQATQLYLRERTDVPFDWERLVVITTVRDLMTRGLSQRAAAMLLTGPMTAQNAALLALPLVEQVTVLTHGPWETARAARQIEHVRTRLSELVRGPVRERAVQLLFAGQDPGPLAQPLPLELTTSSLAAPQMPSSARTAVWDPFSVRIAQAVGRQDDEGEGPVLALPTGLRGDVLAVFIQFQDGAGLFEPNCPISKVEGGDVREVAAKSLTLGDRIVLVDRGAQRDLFDLVVEKLEDLPEFAAVAMLVHEWHARARHAGLTSGLTYEEILRRMGDASVTSPATIGTWVRGTVHGPLDPGDIRRFGRAVGDEFLAERWEAIGRALTTMRTHRRRIGHMLARVLTGLSADDLEDEGYFDRRLGIHFSDFTEAVSDHVVQEVGRTTVRVPYQYANRLLPVEDINRFITKASAAA